MKEEYNELFARIDDLRRRADRGEIAVSAFLSPREAHYVKNYFAHSGMSDRVFMYGGYKNAERCRAYILPDYISDIKEYEDLAPYIEEPCVVALSIRGSGYRKLSHRDYLGSVLGLGIERDVLGDIAVLNSEGDNAILFCDTVISDFIINELKKVANDSVRVKYINVASDFEPKREFAHISDTVASARLDCIIASICSLSREKALGIVSSGVVEVDFECETRPDLKISAPCLISVRGYGKFRINSVSDVTRRGRLRLDADKYI